MDKIILGILMLRRMTAYEIKIQLKVISNLFAVTVLVVSKLH